MLRFVTLNSLVHSAERDPYSGNVAQNLRQALLFHGRITIQQALRRANFKFRRSCSYSDLFQGGSDEDEVLLMSWSCHHTESRVTVMSASNSASTPLLTKVQSSHRHRELRSSSQQTDISCPSPGLISSGLTSPVPRCEGDELRACTDSPMHSSPATSLLYTGGRSRSILGSVCALLLNTQGSPCIVSPKLSSVSAEESAAAGTAGAAALDRDICRICFGGESAARLVRPCGCRGTVAAVHRACLERWLLQAAASHCELCRHHYHVTRTHKCGWAAAAAGWAASGPGRALCADAWRGAALAAAGVAASARALAAADTLLREGARRGGAAALAANLLSSVIIGLIGAMNGLLTTWLLLKIQEYQVSWREWRASTLTLRVALPGADDDADAAADAAADTATDTAADTTATDTAVAASQVTPDR